MSERTGQLAAAVWRCREYMPEPPAFYNHRRRDEDSEL